MSLDTFRPKMHTISRDDLENISTALASAMTHIVDNLHAAQEAANAARNPSMGTRLLIAKCIQDRDAAYKAQYIISSIVTGTTT